MTSLYAFKSYKDYLRSYISSSDQRGTLARLAEAAGCQSPYLSKVLQAGSKAQLTHDHIFGVSKHLNLSLEEAKFLKLLLEKERASNKDYKAQVEKEISEIQKDHKKIKNQVLKENLSTGTSLEQIYYTHWLYSALHIATSIPELQSLSALSKHFYLPQEVLLTYLMKLEKINLVQSTLNNKWVWKSGDIHLPEDSPFAGLHQTVWRHQATQDCTRGSRDSLHYSVVQSLSREDFDRLRVLILSWIKSFQKIAGPSTPEELINLNLDFYRVVDSSQN